MKASFDGVNRIISILPGNTSIDIKHDIYSAWKLWVSEADNTKYHPAISCVGGDPISMETSLGSTFFLENGWKIRPQETNHILVLSGNLYSRDGGSPLISTIGNYNVLISMNRSNLIDTVATGGSTIDLTDIQRKLNNIEALVAAGL